MEGLKIPLITIAVLTVFSHILCELFGKGAMRSSLRAVCSIAVLSVLLTFISPITDTISDLTSPIVKEDSKPSVNESFDDLYIKQVITEINKYTAEMIATRFSVDISDVAVEVKINSEDKENILLTEIIVVFAKDPLYPLEVISEIVSNELMCKVSVIINDL